MGESRLRRARDFFVELRRRKVYRVALIYLVAAAGTLELVDVIVPSTRLPGWADELLLALAILGFPLAVVLAWAFEVTPEGVRRATEAESAPAEPPLPATTARQETGRPGGPGLAGPEAGPELDVRAVAILPFDNLSGTEEAAPLVAGLHDDLLTALSKVAGLTVISRTSVRGYRDTEKPVRQIARELHVGTLVEGGVQSAGGRMRLNVQLIDARRDVHRWAETYDEELSTRNIFEIQTDLTKRIVESLEAELTASERERVEGPATGDLEAYRLYARGRTWLDQRTEDGLREAVDRFERAIERDAAYALAWAGLAEALLLFRWYDYEIPTGAPDPATAAGKALELDPELGEAHTSLGILHASEQDGPAARRELERALDLGPGDSEALIWLSWLHLVLGRPAEALPPAERALRLDPLSPVVRVFAAEALLVAGEQERALGEARRAREIQPDWGLPHFMEGLALHHLGRFSEAVTVLRATLALVPPVGQPSHSQLWAALALALAASGDASGARQRLARIEELSGDRADAVAAGLARAALGEVDEAFEAFARVERWGPLETEIFRYLFPDALGPLRDDPRRSTVLREVERSWGL